MSTGKNTPLGNTYAVEERDTTAVVGHSGTISNVTAPASIQETDAPAGTAGGSATWNENSGSTVTQPDTSATNAQGTVRQAVDTSAVTLLDTTVFSQGGTEFTAPAYRAGDSLAGVPGSIADTTRLNLEPGGDVNPIVPTAAAVVNPIDTMFYGSPSQGGPQPGVALAAKMAAPTVASGPRNVTVSWAAAADPAGDIVLGYLVKGFPGGTYQASRAATSVVADEVDPDKNYQFAVCAVTRMGNGPLSDLSAAVQAYNPDAADKLKPAGIARENLVDPIYTPQGGTVSTGPTAAFTDSAALLVLSVDGRASTAASGSLTAYAWDFGDSATGTGATTTHTYAAAGTYTVKLTVTDSQGKTNSVTHSVTVAAA